MRKKQRTKTYDQFLARWNRFWWYTFSFSSRILLIFLPVINLIDLINSDSSDLLLKIIFQILRLVLGLFLVFNVFVLPGTDKFYIPKNQTTLDQSQTYLMYWGVGSTLYLDSLIVGFENYLLDHQTLISPWYMHVLGVGSLILLFISLYKNRRILKSITETQAHKNIAFIGKASQKLSENLTYEERLELENLLLIEKELGNNAVNNLGKLLWLSIVAALVLAVIQELIGRTYTGIVK